MSANYVFDGDKIDWNAIDDPTQDYPCKYEMAILGSDAENAIRTHALAGTVHPYELSFEDGARMRGRFLVQRLDYAGDFNGERTYAIQLESSGQVVPS